MVAVGLIPIPLQTPAPDPMVRRIGYGPVQFTIGDALSMVEQGILPEDVTIELLNGSLVYRDRFDLRGSEIVIGVKHDFVVTSVGRLSLRINSDARELSTQRTLVCSDTHGPIPDAVILRGTLEDYRDRLATAADAYCVIEVADSSYERDSGPKLVAYAKAGIQQYIIINLRGRAAEIYTNPDPVAGTYGPPEIIYETANLNLRVGEGEYFTIPLAQILP